VNPDVQREMVDEEKTLVQAAAGEALRKELSGVRKGCVKDVEMLDDADVDQEKETRSTEKPALQLIHFLKEPKKEGPFTNLRVDQPDGAGETAFIGSWSGG
jgi:hypothetical protein